MLDLIFWIALIIMALTVGVMIYSKVTGKPAEDMKRDTEQRQLEKTKKAEQPSRPVEQKPVNNHGMIYPSDQQYAENFLDAYRRDLNKTDWYQLTNKELKEDFEGEKVYKYYPYKLDFELRGCDVYAPLKKEMVKIGTVTEEQAEIIQKDYGSLRFFANIYKEVYDTVEIIEDDPLFGFYVRKYDVFK